ncbi:Rrf2 family transcriptional regulator [Microbulbifer elongatus]|uniref:Rrf2 family transcriptional regulator n=1 Tax=Microbulbifer elongatus TaxID=86173 RepID=A0ABT1P499_9GAMM|nr:Rrf2 family transcriptional regulator [Microbulbifer elongatus]MCQ3829859.1 Rrf2 family transcriptional regulator [Microbulbifer elongatus]
MKRDSRLSGVLHVLLHMAEFDGPLTSEALAGMMQTNPVVIRRILAGLRKEGLVHSEKGHGGGWRLAKDLESVTLYDIHLALGAPGVLALGHRTEAPGCLVEQAVNSAMGEAFDAAEALLLSQFQQITLASLSRDFHQRLDQRGITQQALSEAAHMRNCSDGDD